MPVWSGRSPDFQKEKGVVWALAQPARPQCPALLLLELLVNRECISNCFTLGQAVMQTVGDPVNSRLF